MNYEWYLMVIELEYCNSLIQQPEHYVWKIETELFYLLYNCDVICLKNIYLCFFFIEIT